MPTNAAAGKPSKADKAAARAEKRAKRRETWNNLRQAFVLTRRNDPKFLPYLAGAALGTLVVVYVIAFFASHRSPWVPIPIAIVLAVLAAMLVFSRRAQKSMFTQAVAGTTQLDAIHRLVGRPGVVLVGEGAPHRVRGLLAQEKKRTARVIGDVPIYDIVVGRDAGDIALPKLNRYLMKLPSNLSKEQVGTLEKRLAALGGSRTQGLPQGPIPQGARMRNVQRTARRRG